MKDIISKYIHHMKSNRLFRTTLKTYLPIACIVFLAYALVMVMNVYHAAISQLTSAELKMLSQSETTNDFILRDINSSADHVFEKEATAINAMTKPYTFTHSYEFSQLISEMKSRTSAIDKVYFFNLKNDCIYTGENPVYSTETFPDKELIEIISEPERFIINKPHILKYEDGTELKSERVLLSIYKYSEQSCMAVILNSDVFNSMVNADFENKNQSMIILKSDGTVLSSTEPEQFGQNMADDEIVKKINRLHNDSGYINHFGRIYCYKKSTSLNSLYICSFRSSSVIVSYIWMFMVIILFTMLLLLLYLMSSIHISMSIFRPFRRLRTDVFNILGLQLDDSDEKLGTDDDLELISKNLADIRSKYDSMQRTEYLYTETVRNELVYKLLTGSYGYGEDELEDYDITLPYPYNTLLLLRLDKTHSIGRSNIELIQYGIANAGTELLTGTDMKAYSTTYSDEYDVIFLINHRTEEFDVKNITRIQKFVRSVFSITVSASYDSAPNSTDAISQMYNNVKFAMQYRLVKGHESILQYSSLLSSISGSCEYPDKLEKNVLREINSRSREKAAEAVDRFIEAISSMPYAYIMVYSSILAMAILPHTDDSNREGEENSHRHDIISTEIMRVETIDELREMLISKCNDAIIAISHVEISDKHQMIASSIEEYINEHYADPNLSIDEIASYVNKSANYTRNIFKQNIGISISEYITKKRFDAVKRMLVETNLTAQAIAQKAGMNPGSYFYTAFKKYTGYTPDQYRKQHMNKQNI